MEEQTETLIRGNAIINSANRGEVKRWLTEQGVPFSISGRLTVAELSAVYNDTTDATLRDLQSKAQTEPKNEPEQTHQHQPMPTPRATVPADVKGQAANLANALASILEAQHAAPIDENRIIELIHQHAPKPPTITVQIPEQQKREIARQHFKFPLLLATVAAHVPAYLVGPAGTGKTNAAHATAKVLDLPYSAISVGPMPTKSDLFGMRDANGIYHESEIVNTATNGGVFLFDEFDAGNPSTLTAVNMLLANGNFATPDGMREKHKDFIPIFALNTYGTGADRQYVGRNQLDAATLDRGAFIDWPLDESLEASFVGVDLPQTDFNLADGGIPTPAAWLTTVKTVRQKVKDAGLRHVVSPRATIYGAALAAAGVGLKHLTTTLLYKGLDAAAVAKIAA